LRQNWLDDYHENIIHIIRNPGHDLEFPDSRESFLILGYGPLPIFAFQPLTRLPGSYQTSEVCNNQMKFITLYQTSEVLQQRNLSPNFRVLPDFRSLQQPNEIYHAVTDFGSLATA
jgi:hypothetical protein